MCIMTEYRAILLPEGLAFLEYQLSEEPLDARRSEYAVSVRNITSGEHARVRSLTTDRRLARQFFTSVVSGQVTPVTLRDVAEDFVAEL